MDTRETASCALTLLFKVRGCVSQILLNSINLILLYMLTLIIRFYLTFTDSTVKMNQPKNRIRLTHYSAYSDVSQASLCLQTY